MKDAAIDRQLLLQRVYAPAIWDEEPIFCFTSDLDWASEAVIEEFLRLIPAEELKLTAFVTHHSPQISQLAEDKKIYRGIHPNFLEKSSHGNSFREVIETCRQFAPEAIGSRSHRVFDVTDVSHLLRFEYGFSYTSNIITTLAPQIRPLLHESTLIQFPVFFEDGSFLFQNLGYDLVSFERYFRSPGLKVISFHPMNIAFNTPSISWMRAIKDSMSRKDFNNIDRAFLRRNRNDKKGIYRMIVEIIEFSRRHNFKIFSMDELYYSIMKNGQIS